MKYLILLAVVIAVLWFIRNNRRNDPPAPRAASRDTPQLEPEDMVRCTVCSLHLPRADALPGPDGRLYCCAEHRGRGDT